MYRWYTLVGAARVGRETEMWRALRALRVEAVDMGPDEPVLVATLRARHSLKMPDTCVLAAATHLDAPLATFDDRLDAVAAQLSLRHHA